MNRKVLLLSQNIVCLLGLLILIGCKSTSPMQSAQKYCLEHDPDLFNQCVKYRKDYLTEKQNLIEKFKQNQQQCEYYALQKSGAGANQCNNHTLVKNANMSVGANRTTQNCQNTNNRDAVNNTSMHQARVDMKKEELEKQCMKQYGWKNIRSYRPELKLLKHKFGYIDL